MIIEPWSLTSQIRDRLDQMLTGRTHAAIPSGPAELDVALGGGLRSGQLMIVTGAPGVGVSMFTLGIARSAAITCAAPTLYVAPDADDDEVVARVVAAETAVPVSHLRTGNLSASDLQRIEKHGDAIQRAPLILSTNWLRAADQPLDAVIDDYVRAQSLELVILDCPPDDATMIRRLKVAAQTNALAVVLCLRAPIGRSDRGTACWSLIDTPLVDEVSAHADVVLGLHRPDLPTAHQMDDRESSRAGEADIEIVKHRYGPTRVLPPLAFQGDYARFIELRS